MDEFKQLNCKTSQLEGSCHSTNVKANQACVFKEFNKAIMLDRKSLLKGHQQSGDCHFYWSSVGRLHPPEGVDVIFYIEINLPPIMSVKV